MRTRSATWQSITANSEFLFDVKLDINGTEYTRITAPKITRAVIDGPLKVGDCISSMMEVSIDTDDDIPRSAQITIYGRVMSKDTLTVSEWLPFGTYFIDSRPKNYYGYVTLSCFDAMLKAEGSYADPSIDVIDEEWPKTMEWIVDDIAERIGVEVASNTIISDTWTVNYPQFLTMREVLGYIGAVHGGNFIINREGKLELVKLFKDTHEGAVNVILGKYEQGLPVTVKGIIATDESGTEFTNGDILADGIIRIDGNPYITQDITDELWEEFEGKVYYPYQATRCITDPAFEVGDPVNIGNLLHSHFYVAEETLDHAYLVSLSCPVSEEMDSEYPYKSAAKKLKEQIARNSNTFIRSLEETISTITAVESNLDASINRLESEIADLDEDTQNALESGLQTIRESVSEISQRANEISLQVETKVAEYDGSIADLYAKIEATESRVTIEVGAASQKAAEDLDAYAEAQGAYLEVTSEGVKVDEKSGTPNYMRLEGEDLSYRTDLNDTMVAHYGASGMQTPEAVVEGNLTTGEYKWINRGHRMSLVYIGD